MPIAQSWLSDDGGGVDGGERVTPNGKAQEW